MCFVLRQREKNKLATDPKSGKFSKRKQHKTNTPVRNGAMVTAIGPHDMGSLPAISASGTLPEKGDRQHAFWERGLLHPWPSGGVHQQI